MSLLDQAKTILSRQLALRAAYKTMWDHPQGHMVLTDLLRESGVLTVGHVQGDPHAAIWHDGRRSAGLHIIHRLRWSEGEMMQLAMQQTSDQLQATQEGSDVY
jgi:hypothetical protein